MKIKGLKKVDSYLRSKKGRTLNEVFRNALTKGMWLYEGYAEERYMSGRRGNMGLRRQTGQLAGSWHVKTKGRGLNTIAQLATGVPYARIHEYGGTITPKRARALSVPLNDIADKVSSPREMPNLVMIKPHGSEPLLVDKNSGMPMFSLQKSVTIPKRMNVVGDFRTRGLRIINLTVSKALRRLLKR